MHIDSLADLIRELDSTVESKYKVEIAALPDERLFELHFGVNALIRSMAYYENSSQDGKALFDGLGFPDEGSAVLGRIYWRHLRHEPINRESLVPVIEKHSLLVFGEEASNLAEGFARSYATLCLPKDKD